MTRILKILYSPGLLCIGWLLLSEATTIDNHARFDPTEDTYGIDPYDFLFVTMVLVGLASIILFLIAELFCLVLTRKLNPVIIRCIQPWGCLPFCAVVSFALWMTYIREFTNIWFIIAFVTFALSLMTALARFAAPYKDIRGQHEASPKP
ncbi:hypothetical protein [Pseudomonas typographi]|uniref:Transmembrane protein n=1 Tax=Pseudomonas typographi TaxID=2715964 RepID=A0ABR7Z4B5_9PSED|nr:hypothetical protein [Pseudomonas typographi]MBD1600239.1 hypothetical protein [Pseudomonas typographi]